MPTFKAIVKSLREDGYYKVYIRVTHRKQLAYISTDMMVNKNKVKNKEIVHTGVLGNAAILIKSYNERLLGEDIRDWDVKDIVQFLTEERKEISFSDYAKQFYGKIYNEGRDGTAQNYKVALIKLQKFSGKSNLMFSDVTSKLINSWIESLKDTKKAKNGYPKAIKTMFEHGKDEYNDYDRNIIRIKNHPFKKVAIPKQEVPEKRALESQVINAFFDTDISRLKAAKGGWISRAQRAKDVCTLILCLAGINTADLYDLKPENLRNGKLCYNRKKTRGRRENKAYIEIKVPDIIKPIFEKYKGKRNLFSFAEIYSNHRNFNKCINEGIADVVKCYNADKEVAQEMGYITTYLFRHS